MDFIKVDFKHCNREIGRLQDFAGDIIQRQTRTSKQSIIEDAHEEVFKLPPVRGKNWTRRYCQIHHRIAEFNETIRSGVEEALSIFIKKRRSYSLYFKFKSI
jgi:hypothetical protein